MAVFPDRSVPDGNQLLRALSDDVLAALRPKLTAVPLAFRQSLYRANGQIDAVYFLTSGMTSMVATFEDGVQAEVGIIGREGLVGYSLAYGVDTSYVDSFIQMPGGALRMDARVFRREVEDNAPLRSLLFRYGEALHAQIAQTAACNGRHGLEQRMARWLLMAHDRSGSDALPLTQEFIAAMLGVHRPSITVTAGILQRAGLIRYVGGQITVLDRSSLEAASCECYGAVRRRFEALLGQTGS